MEGELAEVQPLIDAARQAVGSIKSEHLSEIKSLKASTYEPPGVAKDVSATAVSVCSPVARCQKVAN